MTKKFAQGGNSAIKIDVFPCFTMAKTLLSNEIFVLFIWAVAYMKKESMPVGVNDLTHRKRLLEECSIHY